MKPTTVHTSEAFTLIELMGVIIVVFMLVWIILPTNHKGQKAPRIQCVNNLKQIGTAYRIWANDNDDHFPALQSVTNGGWRELLTNANQGFMCWTNYVLMQNEMGQSTRIIVCPSDERKPADTFSKLVSNTNLSYFVGMSADNNQPQALLGGDRNLERGTEPDHNYGFSPESGQGNDVAIQTNSQAGPVCWSLKIHSHRFSDGAGNILLVDGSVQQATSDSFRTNWQPIAGQTTHWPAGHIPSSPSIRVLFP